jgi:hypothetical protein
MAGNAFHCMDTCFKTMPVAPAQYCCDATNMEVKKITDNSKATGSD